MAQVWKSLTGGYRSAVSVRDFWMQSFGREPVAVAQMQA